MALSAVETVALVTGDRKEIDIKRYAKVEKVQRSKSKAQRNLNKMGPCGIIIVIVDTF